MTATGHNLPKSKKEGASKYPYFASIFTISVAMYVTRYFSGFVHNLLAGGYKALKVAVFQTSIGNDEVFFLSDIWTSHYCFTGAQMV